MIVLDDWQKEVLAYKGDILLCTGRRVGKTYILARKAVDRMLEKKIDIIIFSLTEEQAMIILAMAQNYLLEKAPHMLSKKKIDTNKKTLSLKNGSKMRCRPAGDTGDSGRGFDGGIIVVDEAARMNKLFWIAVLPIILMKAGEVWISSTPHGKEGYFWERYNEVINKRDPNARFKVFYITTEEVIRTRKLTFDWTEQHRERVLKILEQDKKNMTAQEYGQEYNGLFLDELRQYFPDDLINQVCILKRVEKKGQIFMGVDIARMGGDKTVFSLIDKQGENCFQVENIIKGKQDTYITEQEIINISKMWGAEKIGIDAGAGALGVGIYDRLMHNSDTMRKVVAMSNQKVSLNRDGTDKQRIFKEDMYEHLKWMLESGKLKLLDDEEIKIQLKSIQLEIVEGKTKIFAHPSADCIEALIRAAYLGKQKVNKLFITYI